MTRDPFVLPLYVGKKIKIKENIMKSDLSKCKVGDWIWTIKAGWTRVIEIDNKFACVDRISYFHDGKEYDCDAHASAFTFNPFDPEDGPPCGFKEGQVIVVWDDPEDEGKYASIFKGYDSNSKYPYDTIINNGDWKHARALNATEKGE